MRLNRKKLLSLVLLCGVLPAFFLQCDKAALNFQRGFWQGLGFWVSEWLGDTALPGDTP